MKGSRAVVLGTVVSLVMLLPDASAGQTREHDHIGQFNFSVELGGGGPVGFENVEGMDAETEVIEYRDDGDAVEFTYLTPIEFTGFLEDRTPYSMTWVATKGRAALIPDIRTYENSMRIAATGVFDGTALVGPEPAEFELVSLGDFRAEDLVWQVVRDVEFLPPAGPTGDRVVLEAGSLVQTVLVPEPATVGLLGLGAAVLAARKRRR